MYDEYKSRNELNDLKQFVNLVQYARSIGYEVVRHKSCAASKCLRHAETGDKVIVARSRRDDHWIYFSLTNDRDNGTIIDFVQARLRPEPNLAQVRAHLREYLGRPEPVYETPDDRIVASERDRRAAAAKFMGAVQVSNLRYLNERGLRQETLAHPQFASSWRRDRKTGNALFVHRDASGISGFEQKNRGFTGFAKGGEKTLWYSTPHSPIERLVVAESAVDALSYYQLHPQEQTRYLSVAGQFSPLQAELLARAAAKLPAGSEVVLAVDADAAGDKIAEKIRLAMARDGVSIRRDSPSAMQCKDWNDVLKLRERPFIQALATPRELTRPSRAQANRSIELDR
jgi:hypothetical protein